MNAPPFPVNPDVGQQFGDWCWNGARWVPAQQTAISVNTVVFTASGPYSPSAGLVSCVVECIGGGGGGGGAQNPTATWILGGGGGGSGGYSRKALPAALVQGGVAVTVAGSAPTSTPGQPTSFGALCVANGGGGGQFNNAGTTPGWWGLGGAPAAPGVGDVAFSGAPGGSGMVFDASTFAQMGAAMAIGGMMFGGAQTSDVGSGASASGLPAVANSGAGGGGAVVNQIIVSTGGIDGGDGGSGLCVVTEYIAQDYVPPEEGWVNVNARVAVTQVPWRGPGPCPPGYYDNPQVTYDGDD